MATTNHPKTFADLYTVVLNNVGADSSITATVAEAKRMVNTALHDIHLTSGEKFIWAHRDATIRTHPQYETGTVTATIGSTTLTGSSTLWNTANDFSENNARVGAKAVISGTEEVYEVSAVGSDTAITLATPWIDATVSAASYVVFEDEYALASDFLRPINLNSFDTNNTVPLIGKRAFEGSYPRNKITGSPVVATIVDKPFSGNTTPVRKVRFHKPPDVTYLVPYGYVTSNLAVDSTGSALTEMSSDTDEPIVPLSFRMMIAHHAMAQFFRDRMDDHERGDRHTQLYGSLLGRALTLNEIGSDRPVFQPKVGPYRRGARTPYSGSARSGRHTAGSAFDEMR